jgi:hypothetical protein
MLKLVRFVLIFSIAAIVDDTSSDIYSRPEELNAYKN